MARLGRLNVQIHRRPPVRSFKEPVQRPAVQARDRAPPEAVRHLSRSEWRGDAVPARAGRRTMTLPQSGSWLASWVSLAASAVTLGLALQVANGFYDPTALRRALCRPRPGDRRCAADSGGVTTPGDPQRSSSLRCARRRRRDPDGGAAAGDAWNVCGRRRTTSVSSRPEWRSRRSVVAFGLLRIRAVARLWFPAVLVIHLALGVWMMSASPSPPIDVVQVHQRALRALGRGRNPYRITFTNIYGRRPRASTTRRRSSGGRVLFGYPYPPMSLLLAAPGQLMFRDYRYAELAALVGAAALLGYAESVTHGAARGRVAPHHATGILRAGARVDRARLRCSCSRRRPSAMVRRTWWSAWVAGLFVVTKQYLGLAAPLLWRFGAREPGGALPFVGSRRPRRRQS